MNKQELLSKIRTKPSWSINDLQPIINDLEITYKSKIVPNHLKAGDIIYNQQLVHPALIIKVIDEETILCSLLTSNDKFKHNLCKLESRIFQNTYVSKSLMYMNNDVNSYICTLDNRLQFYNIIRSLKKVVSI